jgi:peptidoglycan/xylan/chitin deacetylase (PgdA/CDA1 family)
MFGLDSKALGRKALDAVGNTLLSPPRTGFGYYVNHGPRSSRRIALTFDDGPNTPSSERLLDALGELDVKVTFFCVGVNIRQCPEVVRRAHAAGHDIGSHSMQHRRASAFKTNAEHIEDAEREIESVIQQRPALYRPPWGWLTPWEGRRLAARGYQTIGWDVSTPDWEMPTPSGKSMADLVCEDARPGSIVLFHDGRAFQARWEATETIAAIRDLVPRLRADGYQFCTVSELLGVPAYAG